MIVFYIHLNTTLRLDPTTCIFENLEKIRNTQNKFVKSLLQLCPSYQQATFDYKNTTMKLTIFLYYKFS